MINYGRVRGTTSPLPLEITSNLVLIASNVEDYTEEFEDETLHIYEYDYVSYTKDEYLAKISQDNASAISQLSDELSATKILLGVN